MARRSLTFSITVLSFLFVLIQCELAIVVAHTVPTTNPAASFITTSCHATTYPSVCVQSLGTYASTIQTSHRQLVTIALFVSMDTAQSTKNFFYKLSKFQSLKPREFAAIKDCLEEVNDSVDMLSKAVLELKILGRTRGPKFMWHMSNLQTWVSAALTDANTCADGFAGLSLNSKIKFSIRAQMTNLGQVTSNALALCNQFVAKNQQ